MKRVYIPIISLLLALLSPVFAQFPECPYNLTKKLSNAQKEQLAILRKVIQGLKETGPQTDLVSVIGQVLDLRGVDYKIINDGMEIVITSSDRSVLNLFAKHLYENVGKTKLKYDPRQTKDTHGIFLTNISTVYMNENFMTSPRRTSTLEHEVTHAILHFNESQGSVGVFFGDIMTIAKNVKITDSAMYEDYLSFEEAMTYPISLKTIDQKDAENGFKIATSISKITAQALQLIKKSPQRVKFSIEQVTANYMTSYDAVLVSIMTNGMQIDLPYTDAAILKLVRQNKGKSKPLVLARLTKQFSILKQLAGDSLPHYKKYLELANLNRALSPSELETVHTLAAKLAELAETANNSYRAYVASQL